MGDWHKDIQLNSKVEQNNLKTKDNPALYKTRVTQSARTKATDRNKLHITFKTRQEAFYAVSQRSQGGI
eukprot:m.122849 g.122849  ORF g.122849 m.122849 type:complete len:69 (-) comp15661_c0_seq1:652-858(-)